MAGPEIPYRPPTSVRNGGELLRDLRWARRMSQRKLAQVASVPRATIERIESGATADPRLSTVAAILSALGYELQAVDTSGVGLAARPEFEGAKYYRDRAGRRLPAHLPALRLRHEMDGWWGWRRIAWQPTDKRAPKFFTINPSLGGRWWSNAWEWRDVT